MDKKGDTGTHGKHQTKSLRFLVHQQRPARAKSGTTHGKHHTKNLKFLVHQQRLARSKIGILGPMANITVKI